MGTDLYIRKTRQVTIRSYILKFRKRRMTCGNTQLVLSRSRKLGRERKRKLKRRREKQKRSVWQGTHNNNRNRARMVTRQNQPTKTKVTGRVVPWPKKKLLRSIWKQPNRSINRKQRKFLVRRNHADSLSQPFSTLFSLNRSQSPPTISVSALHPITLTTVFVDKQATTP